MIFGNLSTFYILIKDLQITLNQTFYEFYQEFDYIPWEDGYIPPTTIGNCVGPLGAHRIGVKKVKGNNSGGELWLNLNTKRGFSGYIFFSSVK